MCLVIEVPLYSANILEPYYQEAVIIIDQWNAEHGELQQLKLLY
jgi:hypothetical protein